MATYFSILAWRIPWTEEPGGLQSMGVTESDTTERLNFHFNLIILRFILVEKSAKAHSFSLLYRTQVDGCLNYSHFFILNRAHHEHVCT